MTPGIAAGLFLTTMAFSAPTAQSPLPLDRSWVPPFNKGMRAAVKGATPFSKSENDVFVPRALALGRSDVRLWIVPLSMNYYGINRDPTSPQQCARYILSIWQEREPDFAEIDNYLILVYAWFSSDGKVLEKIGYVDMIVGPALEKRGLTKELLASTDGPLLSVMPNHRTTDPERQILQVIQNCWNILGPAPRPPLSNWLTEGIMPAVLMLVLAGMLKVPLKWHKPTRRRKRDLTKTS